MAPMTCFRAIGIFPIDLMVEYYNQRSSEGLIITEGKSTSSHGLGYARISQIFNKQQLEGCIKATTAINKKGAEVVFQLMYVADKKGCSDYRIREAQALSHKQ